MLNKIILIKNYTRFFFCCYLSHIWKQIFLFVNYKFSQNKLNLFWDVVFILILFNKPPFNQKYKKFYLSLSLSLITLAKLIVCKVTQWLYKWENK